MNNAIEFAKKEFSLINIPEQISNGVLDILEILETLPTEEQMNVMIGVVNVLKRNIFSPIQKDDSYTMDEDGFEVNDRLPTVVRLEGAIPVYVDAVAFITENGDVKDFGTLGEETYKPEMIIKEFPFEPLTFKVLVNEDNEILDEETLNQALGYYDILQ